MSTLTWEHLRWGTRLSVLSLGCNRHFFRVGRYFKNTLLTLQTRVHFARLACPKKIRTATEPNKCPPQRLFSFWNCQGLSSINNFMFFPLLVRHLGVKRISWKMKRRLSPWRLSFPAKSMNKDSPQVATSSISR